MISKNLETSLNRALSIASNFNHKCAKLEHLLLALIEDVDVNYVLSKCDIRAEEIIEEIININNILLKCDIKANNYSRNTKDLLQSSPKFAINNEIKPISTFKHVIHKAIIRAHSLEKGK